MSIEFFQTGMGRRFYESTMPDIAIALLRIAGAMEKPPPGEVIREPSQAQHMLGRIDAYLESAEPARPRYRNIVQLLSQLADAEEGACFCRLTLDPDGSCRCSGLTGDCDGCSECPTGKARSILVALGLA